MTSSADPPKDFMAQWMVREDARILRDYPHFASAYETLIARLSSFGAGAGAPRVGDNLPAFLLPDETGHLVSLQDFSSTTAIVISINRGHWCTYCRVEFESLQNIAAEIQKRGAALLAITPDRQAYNRTLRDQLKLSYPVLSDIDNGYAASLGLIVWCGDEVRDIYRTIDWNLDAFQGNEGWMVPIPATYVVTPQGRIKACFVDADFRRRMETADILDAIEDRDRRGLMSRSRGSRTSATLSMARALKPRKCRPLCALATQKSARHPTQPWGASLSAFG